MDMPAIIFGLIIFLALAFIVFPGCRVVQDYERGVTFILGRLIGAKGPGFFWVPPLLTQMIKVDMRIITLQVPPQEIITRDNVTIKVTAVVYFQVTNPTLAITNVANYVEATMQIGQTTLRNVLGQSDLDELLANRIKINTELQTIIDDYTEQWGVKVTAVEIKDIELPSTMQRAMAKQAEAEREKRAKVIHAEGELRASTPLAQAAGVIASQPSAMALRYLQTLTEIATEKNSTIIFPVPIELIQPVLSSVAELTTKIQEQPPVERPLTERSSYERPIEQPSLEQPSYERPIEQPSLERSSYERSIERLSIERRGDGIRRGEGSRRTDPRRDNGISRP